MRGRTRALPPLSFFFNDTATTEIYTLSLHDALPISPSPSTSRQYSSWTILICCSPRDRKSTRLNSSHRCISYAVFCLKKQQSSQDIRHYSVGGRVGEQSSASTRED